MKFASKCSIFSFPESVIENSKLYIFDKWLISLDRVTNQYKSPDKNNSGLLESKYFVFGQKVELSSY